MRRREPRDTRTDGPRRAVGRWLERVLGGTAAKSRTPFTIARLPPADAYRVTVWSFDFPRSPSVPER